MLIVGVAIGYLIGTDVALGDNGKLWILVTVAGAFGGMLYTFRDGGINKPHPSYDDPNRYDLGWIADCAYGVAGAYVILLLLPTEIGDAGGEAKKLMGSAIDQMKLLGLALVGGYGGRSLVDRAFANLVKRIDGVQESAEKVAAEKATDAKALELAQLQLDEEEDARDAEDIKTAVACASRVARLEIFKQARAVRTANWKKNPPLMARTIPIFEGLIENSAGEVYHRNHGQLGYALKDKGGPDSPDNDWQGAYAQLERAITLKNQEGSSLRRADGSPAYLMYEFNRAICGIKLGKDKAGILADLQTASQRDSLRKAISKEQIFLDWASGNGVDLKTLDKYGNQPGKNSSSDES